MSPRRAFTCPKCEKEGHPMRVFLLPSEPQDKVPTCKLHNAKMVRQQNRPYFGRPT